MESRSKKLLETKPVLSKKTRMITFCYLWFLTLNVGMSSGIVSPAGAYMARDLQMPGWHYGCLSPVYTIGKVIGAGLFATLFNVMNRKYLMVFAGFFHLFTNVYMTITKNSILFLGLRTLAGIVHIWPCIYTPIWIGQFAPAGWAKFMKNAASVCSGLGRSTGFLIELHFGAPRVSYILIIF